MALSIRYDPPFHYQREDSTHSLLIENRVSPCQDIPQTHLIQGETCKCTPTKKKINHFNRKHHSQDYIFGLTLAGVSSFTICHTLPLGAKVSWPYYHYPSKTDLLEWAFKDLYTHQTNQPTYSKDDRGALQLYQNPHVTPPPPSLTHSATWIYPHGRVQLVGIQVSNCPGDGTGYLWQQSWT